MQKENYYTIPNIYKIKKSPIWRKMKNGGYPEMVVGKMERGWLDDTYFML